MQKIINVKIKVLMGVLLIAALSFLLAACTKNVTDKEISVEFEKEDYTGEYTGVLESGQANGEGEFKYKDGDDYLTYKGEFKDGQFSGKGTLKTNLLKVKLPEVTRIGEYDGDVVDGVPNGQGTFNAVNSDNEEYTYTGEWQGGTWHGQGTRTFKDKEIFSEEGNYESGDFKPTVLETYASMGTSKNMLFIPTEKAKQFLTEHEDLFPIKSEKKAQKHTDNKLQYKHIQKNPDDHGDQLVKLANYRVEQIWENDIWNRTVTRIVATDSNYDNVIHIDYLGKTKLYEGDKLNVYGLPLNDTSWENVGGGTTLAIVIAGSYIEKL